MAGIPDSVVDAHCVHDIKDLVVQYLYSGTGESESMHSHTSPF